MPVHAAPARAAEYLAYALPASVPRLPAARLGMHGAIRLNGRWRSFRGSEWLHPLQGFDWRARVRVGPAWVSGYDRLLDGRAEMRWRLFGLIPVVRAEGPDVTRSAVGRAAAECVWAPAALLDSSVGWSEAEDGWLRAEWRVAGEPCRVELDVAEGGALRAVRTERWGDPDGQGWRSLPFGALVEAEASFGGVTIPSRLRVGWWFGEQGFERDGEFFRVTVDAFEPAAEASH